MKVVFCSSEIVPFAKTGGMADVCGALPLALEELGCKVMMILPRYKCVASEKYGLQRVDKEIWKTTIGKDIEIFFLENAAFFDRDELYGDQKGDYPDNLERFQFYCWKSLELLKKMDINADIIHCHDWQTCLIPAYLKFSNGQDPFFKKMKSILTIHNLAYQGLFPKAKFSRLNLDKNLFSPDYFEFYDQINFLKGGIVLNDLVTTVSQTYAREIQTNQLGCGLDGVLKQRKKTVVGILNGLDYTIWDPETDNFIHQNYSAAAIENKRPNKKYLQEQIKLPVNEKIPLLGFIGRLSHQKGLDLFYQSVASMMKMDLQVVLCGVGEAKYQTMLTELAARYPNKIAICLEFNEQKAHQIYAGCDGFLMPSTYEPCGLSQMISLRYGTIPIVHQTGGLADTIVHFNKMTKEGNGFLFQDYTVDTFTAALKEMIDTFQQPEIFNHLIRNAFKNNFSWTNSAKQYLELYQSLKDS